MQFGPNLIYQCPHCGNYLQKGSLQSGNTFGAKLYSDGKQMAPMLVRFPDIVQCNQCAHYLWLSKLEQVGIVERNQEASAEWANAYPVDFLKRDAYFKVLESGIVENEEDELFVRTQLWHSYNDKLRIRKRDLLFKDEQEEMKWRENCIRLIALLDSSDVNDTIMIAELYRNLGDFDRCMEIINRIENDELDWLKEKFSEACEAKNRWVFELN